MLRSLGSPLLAAMLFLLPLPVGAATISLQNGVNGYAGAEETFLVGDGVRDHANWGGRPDLYVGTFAGGPSPDEVTRALLRFDLAPLAGQYTSVTRITLRLTVIGAQFLPNTVGLFQVAAANAAWVEGSADGRVINGFSSWANLSEPATAWDGGAGLGSSGYGGLLASAAFDDDTTGVFELTLTDSVVATALVDAFLSGANGGFLLRALDETHRTTRSDIIFFASEHAVVAERPELEIEYTPVPEPLPAALGFGAAVALAMNRAAKRGRSLTH